MAEDAKSVAEQVQEISERWNPKPTSDGVHTFIGDPVPEGDTRATNSGGDARQGSPLSSKVDASRMDLYGDDLDGGGDEKDLDDMDKSELQDAAERRGLAKSGSKDDLKARIREHDESDDDEDDEDDES